MDIGAGDRTRTYDLLITNQQIVVFIEHSCNRLTRLKTLSSH